MDTIDYFPGMTAFINKVMDENKSKVRQYTDIFSSTINLIELSLQLFIVSTIRVYEDRLTKEIEPFIKKTKPIKETLRNKYVAPSLGTLTSLAKACTFLIDDTAPIELIRMKDKLNKSILMESIGIYLNDLTKIFDSLEEHRENAPQVVNREKSKRLFHTILNDFVAFRNDSAHISNIGNIIEDNDAKLNLNIKFWRAAFMSIIDNLKPLLANEYRLKSIEKIYDEGGTKMILIHNRTFNMGSYIEDEEKIKLEEWYEEQWSEKYELLLSEKNNEKKSIEIFPFIVLKEDKLFYYKKTKSLGYQYYSIIDDRTHIYKSKKKFNRTLFKTSSSGNSQTLFWAQVLPTFNVKSNVKANIPDQGSTQFIGRKKQLNKIREEIIEIPNENGILYGPGGVGKTALLIQLSQQLYNQTDSTTVLYRNIIWVSAKSNFYHWEDNTTISNPQQFESLQNILEIIYRFFDYEDVDEYTFEELKDLVLELLEENKVLLILDNFETITKVEMNKIIGFFGTEVKVHLKRLPNNFKVILTSRELIPSGYKQIKLEGLEFRESKMLIDSIYDRYKDSYPQLSIEQCRLIHDATSGIPIVIKHCLGQMYEFHISLTGILEGLSEESNEVIKFSYAEVLSHLRKDDCFLQILILLEVFNEPISARQIGLILEKSVKDINKHNTVLSNFQCIDKINVGIEEKYRVSNQIGLLSKKLIKEEKELANSIRNKIATNLTLEKRMDYAVEELEIIEIFNGYIETQDFTYAEYFLNGEIKKRPRSHLLNFHYALFLRDRKKQLQQAIDILESLDGKISKTGKRDANILLALITTYTLQEFPDYDNANKCCIELLETSPSNQIYLFAAEFYINWSTALKNKKELDPIKNIYRKEKVKELASEGIRLIDLAKSDANSHKYKHLIAQGYFNQWNTEKAKIHLSMAIKLAQSDFAYLQKYERFMEDLQRY